ncbi:MAG TPA: glycosyltransferase family 2 protein [Pyrinomonadaceae bacterium]|nr:glycosyltransferase family 2 protein [Pyrinomonadaceae bacterium]
MNISVVIIAKNEETNIERALKSVEWADEIVVVDAESTDRTREIAASFGAKVHVRAWKGFSAQKQFATEIATHDWVLSLDADEEVTPELRAEIQTLFHAAPDSDGYLMPRLSIYMGRRIRHCGWYPDRQLRLFDRRKGRWNSRLIHESVEMVDGAKIGKLRSDLLHFSVLDASHHHRMIGERYAPLAARQMFAEGKRTSFWPVLMAGPLAFVRTFFFKLGFLDGLPGYTISRFAAHHAFLKHLLLLELQQAEESRKK